MPTTFAVLFASAAVLFGLLSPDKSGWMFVAIYGSGSVYFTVISVREVVKR